MCQAQIFLGAPPPNPLFSWGFWASAVLPPKFKKFAANFVNDFLTLPPTYMVVGVFKDEKSKKAKRDKEARPEQES